MTKEEFIAQLERGAVSLANLPVSQGVVRFLAEDLKRGNPEWWQETSKAWARRKFVYWSEAFNLFLNAMHFEALNDPECPLVPYFPSCGGTAEADPARGVARFLAEAPDSFFENLKAGQRRAFYGAQASFWVPHAAVYFQLRQMPFYLVEVNAGAGLHLAADMWGPIKGLQADMIAARIGLDHPALALEDITHRRWLTAGIMPDQTGVIPQFDRAADVMLDSKRRDPAFVQMVDCAPEKAPRFISKNIPTDDPEVGLLVFNIGTTVRMDDEEYKVYATGMADLLKSWGDRALWIEAELVRGEMYAMTNEVRVARAAGGVPQQKVASRTDLASGQTQHFFEETVRFLFPPNASTTPDEFIAQSKALSGRPATAKT